MIDPEHSDANDDLARRDRLTVGALQEEVATRHLGYRRALEAHQARLEHELSLVVATASDPVQHYPTRLPDTWHTVREARQLYEAARAALVKHRPLQ